MLENYPKEIMGKDGTPIMIRPVAKEDQDELNHFFSRIPEEERWFIRADMTDPEVMHDFIKRLDAGKTIAIIAVEETNQRIVGSVRLFLRLSECLRHVAHLQITVDSSFRNQRLGTWMLIDAIKLGMDIGLEKLAAEFVLGVEEPGIAAAHNLGFVEKAVLTDYLKDRHGNYRDVVIMVKSLRQDWNDF
ncbi:MAG: N-acetyltransferase family protein [Desulfomonilaceae bacterium]